MFRRVRCVRQTAAWLCGGALRGPLLTCPAGAKTIEVYPNCERTRSAMNYVEVAQARVMPGLRIVLSPGGPGPWSEAAKGICHVKKLSFVPVAQDVGGPNRELMEWR